MTKRLLVATLIISLQCQAFADQQEPRQISAQVLTRNARPTRTELIYAINAGTTIAEVYLNYWSAGFPREREVRGKRTPDANYYFEFDYYPQFEFWFEVKSERGDTLRFPTSGRYSIAGDGLPRLEDDRPAWGAIALKLLMGALAAVGVGIITANLPGR